MNEHMWYDPRCGQYKTREPTEDESIFKTPKSIYNYLDERIYAQADAKRFFSELLYLTHLKDCNVKKMNALLIAPTGTGKTHLARVLSEITQVVTINCAGLTSEGFKGMNFSQALSNAISSGIDIDKTTIIFCDEADKMMMSDRSWGPAILNSILKIMESDVCQLPTADGKDTISVDFSNISFIFAGTFSFLKESASKKPIGFSSSFEPPSNSVNRQMLLDSKIFTDEFVGRLDKIIVSENPFATDDDYKKILFRFVVPEIERNYGISINLQEQTTQELIANAKTYNTRGLKSLLTERINDLIFENEINTQTFII